MWKKAGVSEIIISVSCHTRGEVSRAASECAAFVLFAPVFEKSGTSGARLKGLEMLGDACREKIPVLALGGVTLENAAACIQAGAAGVAGIRLFQENDLEKTVLKLRALA
jgi:thiamine-phosphate pyrophosphorylase